jgi:hypothetical protein
MSSFEQFKDYISEWCGGEKCFCSSCKYQAVLSHAWIISCFITYFICIICVCLLFIWSNLLLWYDLRLWYYLLLWSYFLLWSYLLLYDLICSYVLLFTLYVLLFAFYVLFSLLLAFIFSSYLIYLCLPVLKKIMFACIYVIVGIKSFM